MKHIQWRIYEEHFKVIILRDAFIVIEKSEHPNFYDLSEGRVTHRPTLKNECFNFFNTTQASVLSNYKISRWPEHQATVDLRDVGKLEIQIMLL